MTKETAANEFRKALAQIDRPGMDKLAAFLETSDFFTAPASTQYHGAEVGGLVMHSYDVYLRLQQIYEAFPEVQRYHIETLKLVALLHDLCKVNFYTVKMQNKKDHTTADGVFHSGWGSYPYFAIDDQLPMGHGEKSLYIIMKHGIPLTDDEAAAIRWHMGGFDDAARSYAGGCSLSAAQEKYPLIVALHMADLAASYFKG